MSLERTYRTHRRLLRYSAIFAGVLLTCGLSASAWLYLYTTDLPPVSQLDAFVPATPSEVTLDSCDGRKAVLTVLPPSKLAPHLFAALTAAEGQPDSRSPFLDIVLPTRQRGGRYASHIARTLACTQQPALRRHLDELRIANGIYRRFNERKILTAYLNRVYFGQEAYGVEMAARIYLGKSVTELSLDEAALLAGLIRAPAAFSPTSHPERALERRNAVLDEMVNQGNLPSKDAERAKAAPLYVLR